ncbi:MAG TPA: hypothetical protein GXX14_00445 [Clostridiaceae bacterium]|nr:hypothetical protein [Clostridiaceae bacterium]
MILHSIIPAEKVFEDYLWRDSNNSAKQNANIEVYYLGQRVEVSPLTNGEYVINRLISTSPKAFLDPRFKPGTIIKATLPKK